MKDISVDDDFFDLGVSSLTVVELQIVIEKALGKSVSTSLLMGSPTISEWISVYTEKMQQDSLESNNT
ncbi:MAG: acyl carrier protein [Alteromonadaceae bacterium]|nr:acyl carrier protein [Alteromonadaceae bacterium]